MVWLDELFNATGNLPAHFLISTIALVTIVVFLRLMVNYAILQRSTLAGETRRRWAVNVRNALLFLLIFGLLIIWAPQLRTLAVSLLAIAVALVLATKDFIDCLSGHILRVITKSYTLGDRIEIAGVRGHVIDLNLLSTTLLEIGPGQTSHQYTGRAQIIPNSLLLKNPVTNESYSQEYRVHIITVPLTVREQLQEAERILLESAWEECRPFLNDAKRQMKNLEGRVWLDAPSVEPRVTFQLPEPGRVNLLLRIPCPTQFPSRLEQAILRKFLAQYQFSGTAIVPGDGAIHTSSLPELN